MILGKPGRPVIDRARTLPARIHGIDCVEVRIGEWSVESGRKTQSHIFYAWVEEDSESRWIAVLSEKGDEKELLTLLDEGFESQWGASANRARKLYDDGLYRPRPDGSLETTNGTGLGAGTYDVTMLHHWYG